ncbi:phage head closure protein [Sphingomonas paucimobilis]|uniref:phage head closure protein n=1 Tax=Sphingomonas paucimobilis TaxID=13689 RepID=UPI00064BDD39|nr:phage head closure protein [Sphingomonas paucimobilis]
MGGYDKRPEFRPNKRVQLERPKASKSFSGAGQGDWEPATPGKIWAEVRDILPGRGDELADGLTYSKRPARIRIRYREGVTGKMRFIFDGRVLQIVAGPAEIGRRYLLEFSAQEYSPAGNPA